MPDAGMRIDLLDVGDQDYADCVLVRVGSTAVLIDGGHQDNVDGDERHPPIPDQLADLLGQSATALHVDLLIVTHAHKDHVGCLPELVAGGLHADHALVADPDWAWGQPDAVPGGPSPGAGAAPLDVPPQAAPVLAALREELLPPDAPEEAIQRFLKQSGDLRKRYLDMLSALESGATNVVRFGRSDAETATLESEFEAIGLRVLGPSGQLLNALATAMGMRPAAAAAALATPMPDAIAAADPVALYRAAVTRILDDRAAAAVGDAPSLASTAPPDVAAMLAGADTAAAVDAVAAFAGGSFVNCQSVVTVFGDADHRALLAGDLQFADPQTGIDEIRQGVQALWQEVAANGPYRFVKLSHHGSDNGFPDDLLSHVRDDAGIGICAGEGTRYDPNRCVLEALDTKRETLTWVRTDRNGRSTLTFTAPEGPPEVYATRGPTNLATPNDPTQHC
jgi:beta-lactamase superfamily II metal-dependent hydrolase